MSKTSNGKVSKICGVTTIGERGQVVIPAKARKLFDIKPGDELVVLIDPGRNMVGFIPAERFIEVVNEASKMVDVLKSKKSKVKK